MSAQLLLRARQSGFPVPLQDFDCAFAGYIHVSGIAPWLVLEGRSGSYSVCFFFVLAVYWVGRSPVHALFASRSLNRRAHSTLTILFSSLEGCLLQRSSVLFYGMVRRGFHVQLQDE